MTIEPDNTPDDVTDNDVELSQDDTLEDETLEDLEEDTLEDDELEGTDDEADEVEAEDEAEDQEAEDQTEEEPAEVSVTLDSGETVSLDELKGGYLRQSDYSRKTQEVANTRKALEEQAQLIESVTNAFVQQMRATLPPEPPMELMATDPQKHYLMSVQRQQALAQVQEVFAQADQAKQVTTQLSQEDKVARAREANDKLVQMFPEAAGGESRKRFFDNVQNVAESIGFTTDELNSVDDPRIFALAHWAKKGLDADRAKKTVKEKVQKAPPAKATKPQQIARKTRAKAKARERLLADDSLENAIALLSDD